MLSARLFIDDFLIPTLVLLGIVLYLLLLLAHAPILATLIAIAVTLLGSFSLFTDTFHSLLKRQFALDYIAILAIIVSLITGEYLVAAIIALMISSGNTLEAYSVAQAKKSLTSLVDRIPDTVLRWTNNAVGEKAKVSSIQKGDTIYIRKGEVISLDGVLESETALIDESSLTGEPYPVEKATGDLLRSGTVNAGEAFVLRVTTSEKDSTYRKIVQMVKEAEEEKAPLIRLADTYSTYFTIITLLISLFAYLTHGGLHGALTVLVIATPCPLIIATPIALLGGVNAAAKRRIIIKKLASLEVLSRITTLVFDKTGTITLGKPQVTRVVQYTKSYTSDELLGIAEAIERSSLHPLAKAIVSYAKEKKAPVLSATAINETIGSGITGTIKQKSYTLKKPSTQQEGMVIELYEKEKALARFFFEDEIKADSKSIITRLHSQGLSLLILTGDKKEAAEKLVAKLGEKLAVKAELKPEEKKAEIDRLKNQKKIVAMIGDGINDAPALARADVGMVFSNEEQTAASEAADIVLLGGDFGQIDTTYQIARRTIGIARQSILWGIGLSILGMIFASLGFIPPLFGAGLQEAIDVAVILNALRASRYS